MSTQPTIKPNFTPLALDILKDRYLHRDCNGITIETPEEMLHRVASCIAKAEAPKKRQEYENKFYKMMARLDFLPNSPTLMNAGRPSPHGQLAACFVIGIDDSMEGICEALRKQMLIHKTGGGTGFNFSHIRPKNSTVNSTNGKASGPVSFMRLFDLSTEVIQQGGMRRGANMAILNADHPDIEEFISCKDEEGVITNFNLSVGLTDDFMRKATDDPFGREAYILHQIAEHAWKTGDPGVVFLDALNRDNPCPEYGVIEATNPCVTGDTLILTTKGYLPIADCIDKSVSVWNGHEWSQVEPMITGHNLPTYLITFSNGSQIRCTHYHHFKLNDDTVIEARNLKVNDMLTQCEFPVITTYDASDTDESIMWCRGFYVGDGTRRRGKDTRTRVTLYDTKTDLIFRFEKAKKTATTNYDNHIIVTLKEELCFDKYFVPDANFTIHDRLNYLAGLIDSDGTRNSQEGSVAISASNKELLDNVKNMLNTLGCKATVACVRQAGKRLAPDGKGGKKLYNKRAEYRLLISAWYVQKLVKLGLKTYRVNIEGNPDRNAARHITVVSIEDGGMADTVYCLTEPRYHMFMANGIPVMNCGESPLLSNEACNLGSINLAHFVKDGKVDYERLGQVTELATRFLNNVIDVSQYPLPEIEQAVKRTRKIGLGVMGWADMLYQLHIPYASMEAMSIAESVMCAIDLHSFKESVTLNEEIGNTNGTPRNATRTCIAPTGTLALLADCSSGIEPIFANYHTRKVTLGDGTVVEKEIYNKWYEALIRDKTLSDKEIEDICKTAYQIPWSWHILHQVVFQRYTNLAVSKTVNLPTEATVIDVLNCYIMAWKEGLKGTTIYRNGSKSSQVLVESALPPVKCTTC